MVKKRLAGFTFVELIFAITVMGVLFALATSVVIGMIRFYTFANTVRTNQQEARSIFNAIANDAADGQVVITGGFEDPTLCIKNSREVITYSLDKPSGILTRRLYNILQQNNCSDTITQNPKSESKMNSSKLVIYGFGQQLLDQGAGGDGVVLTNTNTTSLILEAKFATVSSSPEELGLATYDGCEPRDIYCNVLELNTAVKTSKWK